MEKRSATNGDMQQLVEKYIDNKCSKEELEQLGDIARNDSVELYEALKIKWAGTIENTDEAHWDTLFKAMMDEAKEIERTLTQQTGGSKSTVYSIGATRTRFVFRFAAAGAILLVLSMTVFFLVRKGSQEIGLHHPKRPEVNDIAPGGDKAILTLADGRKIVLDTASNGSLAQQGGIKVIKIGGQLSYNEQTKSTEVLYNTVSTPRGGQYQLELADGSRVWLNAASSLRFPTAFAGKERTVELTGEGYFEVAHNAAMPFHIKVGEMDVKDLGTAFNIDAYGDESNLKTTLVEGSVMVSSLNLKRTTVLKPGQQAVLDDNELLVNKGVDTDEITAWKHGQFVFNETRLDQIMKQIARWYDVDVEYKAQDQHKAFNGIVSRKSNLSEVLDIMKRAGIKFDVQGKKITVLQ